MQKGAIIIEGHVQGLSNTRSLGEKGIPVIVIDKNNCIARYSKYCKKFFKCPDYSSDEFINFLIALCEKEKLNDWILLPSNDHAVFNISKNMKRIEKHCKAMIPEINIIENIYNKKKLLDAAFEINIAIPLSWVYCSYDEILNEKYNYPILIKGKFGLSFYKKNKKKAFLVNNQIELSKLVHMLSKSTKIEEIIVQELIQNDNKSTVSFCAFVVNGVVKTYWMGEKIREHPVRFGTATYARSVYINDLIEPSEKILKKLNYSGVCEIEYLFDESAKLFKLIEINPRTWLWVDLAKFCGVDFAYHIYKYLSEINDNFPTEYKINYCWKNFVIDKYYLINNLLRFKKIKTNPKCICLRNTEAIFKKNDYIPFLAFIILLPYLKKNRL